MRLAILAFFVAVGFSAELPKIYQVLPRVIWVVDNADRVAAAWAKAGVAADDVSTPAVAHCAEYHGHSGKYELRFTTARFANLFADWVQPVAGQGALAEFLKSRGTGVFGLAYHAASIEALQNEVQRMQSLGVRVLERGILNMGADLAVPYVFFDTVKEGKYSLGLIVDPHPEMPSVENTLKVTQFALVARDLAAVSAYWQRLGFPAFTITHPELTGKVYRGAAADFDMRLGWQRQLTVPFEWIQPLKGPNVYEDHIAKRGEGFHHIAFDVPDIDRASAHWQALGYPAAMSGGWGREGTPGSGRFAYHDTHAIGGIDIELLWNYRAPSPKF